MSTQVSTEMIETDAVTEDKIIDGAASVNKIATDAVSEIKILNDAVTLAKMAAGIDGELITYDTSGDPTTIPVGLLGEVLRSAGIGAIPTWGLAGGDYIQVRDEKATTVAGGTFTAGAWQTRVLNTEVNDSASIASLVTNQITLAAGTYRARIRCPAMAVGAHQARLQNVTDTSTILIGSSSSSVVGAVDVTQSFIEGEFTIVASKALEVQHKSVGTQGTNGFGLASSSGATEVYTVAEFWRVG